MAELKQGHLFMSYDEKSLLCQFLSVVAAVLTNLRYLKQVSVGTGRRGSVTQITNIDLILISDRNNKKPDRYMVSVDNYSNSR